MNTKQISLIVAGVVILIGGLFFATGKESLVGGSQNYAFKGNQVYTSGVTLTATTTRVLASNTGRQFAVITNTSANTMYLAFLSASTVTAASTTALTAYTIPLVASSSYTINASNLYTGAIYATGTAASLIRTLEVY